MDKFEQYIKENRLRLDTEDYANSEWEGIALSFKQYNRRKTFKRLYAAATLLVLITFGSVFFLRPSKPEDVVMKTTVLNGVATYYQDEENSAIKLINGAENEIRKQSIPVEYEGMFSDFIIQLGIIDKQYDLYKTTINEHGYSQELIQQVIYNYQLKLSVLQMLQSEIDKINKLTKNKRNENKKIQLHI
jgi:hypothetical protein